jgi:hypothetical protein
MVSIIIDCKDMNSPLRGYNHIISTHSMSMIENRSSKVHSFVVIHYNAVENIFWHAVSSLQGWQKSVINLIGYIMIFW